jgi:hypothetical protein
MSRTSSETYQGAQLVLGGLEGLERARTLQAAEVPVQAAAAADVLCQVCALFLASVDIELIPDSPGMRADKGRRC